MSRVLTEREREVYLLILVARSNKEISRTLGISLHTVRFHVSNLFRKLRVSNRVELLALLLNRSTALRSK